MRLTQFVLLPALALSPFFLAAQSTSGDTVPLLVTSAEGELKLSPDWAVLEVDVANQESSAGAAASRNSVLARRLVDALTAIRGPDDSVALTGVTIRAQENRDGKLTGYQASATVRVVLRRLDQMGHVLDVAFAGGATGIDGVAFHSNREDASAAEVLQRAFTKAEAQARAMAGAAGLRLVKLMRLSTVPLSGLSFALQGGIVARDEVMSYGTLYTPQTIDLSATVYTVWQVDRK